jgi:hypothetical protein
VTFFFAATKQKKPENEAHFSGSSAGGVGETARIGTEGDAGWDEPGAYGKPP